MQNLIHTRRGIAALAALAMLALPGLPAAQEDESADDIHWVLMLTVNEGKESDLQTLMAEMSEATLDEAGTTRYEWLRDGDTVHLYERYVDSDAAMVHLGNFGATFAERFFDALTATGMDVYGPASDALRENLAGLDPAYYELVAGFAR